MTERFKPFAATGLALIKNGKVLLSRRINTGYEDGNYSLIAGHLEGNETAKQCIIREAKEEAGIIITPNDLEVVQVMHTIRSGEYLGIYLLAEKWSGEIQNMEPDKCDELKWFNLENLPNNIIPETKFALENIKNGVHYSEFGWDK